MGPWTPLKYSTPLTPLENTSLTIWFEAFPWLNVDVQNSFHVNRYLRCIEWTHRKKLESFNLNLAKLYYKSHLTLRICRKFYRDVHFCLLAFLTWNLIFSNRISGMEFQYINSISGKAMPGLGGILPPIFNVITHLYCNWSSRPIYLH